MNELDQAAEQARTFLESAAMPSWQVIPTTQQPRPIAFPTQPLQNPRPQQVEQIAAVTQEIAAKMGALMQHTDRQAQVFQSHQQAIESHAMAINNQDHWIRHHQQRIDKLQTLISALFICCGLLTAGTIALSVRSFQTPQQQVK